MRLGKKLKAGLKLGAKIAGGVVVAGIGHYLGSKSQSGSAPTVSPDSAPTVSPDLLPSIPPPPAISDTRKEINRLQALPEPKFRTPEQRASAIQSTDDFIAKYSKFYPDTRP